MGSALPACVVAPELTEGPYYVDAELERIRHPTNTSDGAAAEGAPLDDRLDRLQADGSACMPMEGVIVDVWHCDALGVYSGVQGDSGNFLRGFQRTDAAGKATFQTIYPGWYQGRTVHVHFKIRTDPEADAGFEFTSQLFFDDDLSRRVYATGVYAQKGAQTYSERERRDLQPERRGDAAFGRAGGRRLQGHVPDRRPADQARIPAGRCLPQTTLSGVSRVGRVLRGVPRRGPVTVRRRPTNATGRDPAMIAPRIAPSVNPRRNFAGRLVVSHAGRCGFGPSTAMTDTIAMPSQATIDAPRRW